MALQHFPNAGRKLRSLFLVMVLWAGTALCGCQQKDLGADAWQLIPPTLQSRSVSGAEARLKLRGQTVGSEYTFDEESRVLFDSSNRGIPVKFTSTCISDEDTSEHLQSSGDFTIESSIQVLRLLAPQILRPNSLVKKWGCTISFLATNIHGSTHSFQIDRLNVRLREGVESLSAPGHTKRTPLSRAEGRLSLHCPHWWAIEDASPRDQTGDLSANDRLVRLARQSEIQGTDTREFERRPLCTVVNWASDHVEIVELQRLQFVAPKVASKRSPLLAADEAHFVLRRPLMQWNIENLSPSEVTYFISTESARIRVSADFHLPNYTGWSRFVSAPIAVSTTGAIEQASTKNGLYVKVGPRAKFSLILSAQRDAFCFFDFTASQLNSTLIFDMQSPLVLESLGQSPSGSLPTIDPAVLNSMSRDLSGKDRQLLTAVALKRPAVGRIFIESHEPSDSPNSMPSTRSGFATLPESTCNEGESIGVFLPMLKD